MPPLDTLVDTGEGGWIRNSRYPLAGDGIVHVVIHIVVVVVVAVVVVFVVVVGKAKLAPDSHLINGNPSPLGRLGNIIKLGRERFDAVLTNKAV